LLHRFGAISDNDLNSYLDWIENVWGSEIRSTDWSTDPYYQNDPGIVWFWVEYESVYKNLKKQSVSPPTGLTMDDITNALLSRALGVTTLITNELYGVIVKRPATVKLGDTITIDNWGNKAISFDGIQIDENGKVTSITKKYWRMLVS